jgi:hypothetical protein
MEQPVFMYETYVESGSTGKVRRLWHKFQNVTGKKPKNPN